jgi:long-chain acyl-CoA synthetase
LRIGADKYHRGVKLWDRPLDWLLSLSFRRKVRAKFGGRTKAWVSGGAPLNPEVGIFFQSLGITFLQGYGQTEAGPVISCNRPSAGIRLDTVGVPVLNTEVKFADDGEIMVRGENVMHGYWRNEDETRRVLRDPGSEPGAGAWLATGDVGHLDAKGRIVITDRKRDLIVNDKGDNVSPQRIEGILTLQSEIAQAMVYGDRRPHLVALLVLDPEIANAPDVHQRLQRALDRVNSELSVIERVRRFIVADEPFSIENEQQTPSLKIRRHVISKIYGERLDALYPK